MDYTPVKDENSIFRCDDQCIHRTEPPAKAHCDMTGDLCVNREGESCVCGAYYRSIEDQFRTMQDQMLPIEFEGKILQSPISISSWT